jgi:hypothetical protein
MGCSGMQGAGFSTRLLGAHASWTIVGRFLLLSFKAQSLVYEVIAQASIRIIHGVLHTRASPRHTGLGA